MWRGAASRVVNRVDLGATPQVRHQTHDDPRTTLGLTRRGYPFLHVPAAPAMKLLMMS
jgi:hypothetical protein